MSSSSTCSDKNISASIKTINDSVLKTRVIDDIPEVLSDKPDDYTYVPNKAHLSKCSNKIVACITGFVVHQLRKCLHCDICVDALTDKNESMRHSLIALKTKGGLVFPSNDVIDICVLCEKCYREAMSCTNTKLSTGNIRSIRV